MVKRRIVANPGRQQSARKSAGTVSANATGNFRLRERRLLRQLSCFGVRALRIASSIADSERANSPSAPKGNAMRCDTRRRSGSLADAGATT